jgi:hypothetical protein
MIQPVLIALKMVSVAEVVWVRCGSASTPRAVSNPTRSSKAAAALLDELLHLTPGPGDAAEGGRRVPGAVLRAACLSTAAQVRTPAATMGTRSSTMPK